MRMKFRRENDIVNQTDVVLHDICGIASNLFRGIFVLFILQETRKRRPQLISYLISSRFFDVTNCCGRYVKCIFQICYTEANFRRLTVENSLSQELSETCSAMNKIGASFCFCLPRCICMAISVLKLGIWSSCASYILDWPYVRSRLARVRKSFESKTTNQVLILEIVARI
jgi:hypothetical protein